MHGTQGGVTATEQKQAGFSAERLARIGSFIESEIAAKTIPGATMLIERHGVPVLKAAWGLRDAAARTQMSLDTIFRIYSMTKPLVSVATMMLVEEGRLRLDQAVAEFIPAFANVRVRQQTGDSFALIEPRRAMTVQDLLRHTSGLTYGTSGEAPVQKLYREQGLLRGDFTSEEFADRIAGFPLAYQPGTTWDYSHATDVLGRVVEVVSGKPLSAVLKERLLDPLDMQQTGFTIADPAQHGRLAEPFDGDTPFGPGTRLSNPRVPRAFQGGGGGLVSTLDDYARFARMLLKRGTLDDKTYIGAKILAYMASDHVGASTGIVRAPEALIGPGIGFGLGFAVRLETGGAPYPGSVGEFYWSGIAGTFFWIDPREDLFVVFMMQAPTQRERFRTILKSLVHGAMTE